MADTLTDEQMADIKEWLGSRSHAWHWSHVARLVETVEQLRRERDDAVRLVEAIRPWFPERLFAALSSPAPDTGEETHTRTTTDAGPDFCAECSKAAGEWVRWPCASSSDTGDDECNLTAEYEHRYGRRSDR